MSGDLHDTELSAFNAELRQQTEPAACSGLFRAVIGAYGFDTFACGEVDPGDRDRTVFHLIDWPANWMRFYMQSGMVERDPILKDLGERLGEPFSWSDLRADRRLAEAGREALDLCAAAGWIEGLVVPLPSGGSRIGLVSLAGHRLIPDRGARTHLGLLSSCLYAHVRTLTASKGFAQPPMGLTEREIACLRLVARGWSDPRIAAELGVATTTVRDFVEKAKRRLKVRSRAELTAVAVAYGIVAV